MRLLRQLFGGHVEPITHLTVAAADRDESIEAEIKHHRARTAEVVIAAERSSWQIRQQLAGNVLSIVSGEHR
jgi:hypothetical protein